ncbi:MAG: GAF domain-containing protein, partial [Armatimonadota bacterium]|nr:GAF domain-containing protein [Armatimonadota bacterium]
MTTSATDTTLASLLTEATRLCADDAQTALSRLLALAREALGADAGAVFALEGAGLMLAAGQNREDLRGVADACLRGEIGVTGENRAVLLTAGDQTIGVWAVALPESDMESRWQTLAPFFALALRQSHWQQAAARSQEQAERRLREVATVFEVGQAMDKVEIDRLLDMITEKATHVMDAQACSLLLKLPDTNALVILASCGLPDEVVENTRIFVGEGIAGRVAATGEPLLLNSLDDDPRFQGVTGVPEVTSSICMPMKDENGSVHGVLCIRRRAPSPPFTDEDMKLFSIFATQASLAVNNAQLYAKLSHKIQELSTLAALTETVSSSLDLDQVLNQVADNLIDVVHFDRCLIYLKDIDTERFSPCIVRGFSWRHGEGRHASLPVEEAVVEMVARRQTPIPVDDVATAPGTLRAYGEALGM